MNSIRVKVKQGIVLGCEENLPDGRKFQRFSAIPYAKPPINELRFRSPQKLLKFDQDEIDCTRDRDGCVHRSAYLQEFVGTEDCLNLNVYVPPNDGSKKQLPVMVYIHGGGFNFDSASIKWYSPEPLLMENVIVVTINYRLHVLGFLSLPSKGISGNAGLKDQQMALEWVHENIASFNGDPNKICLFGESAGGASVHYQLLNPKSRKFISSAICQSGCALGDWALQKDCVGATRKLAKLLGCTSSDDEAVYQTLMKTSGEELFNLRVKPQVYDERRRNLPFVFKPSVEEESEDAFLTKPPIEQIKSQEDQINIPVMFGTTDKDGVIMVSSYRSILKKFEEDYVRLVPLSVNIDPKSEMAKDLGEEIKSFYFGSKSISEKTLSNFVDHMTDFHFMTPQTISNELHARYQPKSKQFLYEFCFDGDLNHYKKFLQMEEIKGAGHADDVCYLFDQRVISGVHVNARTIKMRKTICKLWANFARYGDPTPDHDNPLNVKWTPVEPTTKDAREIDFDYLSINDESKMVRNLNKTRMDFWRNVYRKWNKSFLVSKL